jgi:hypothetical protein
MRSESDVVARAFSRSGADVIVRGRHAPVKSTGTNAVFFEADVRVPEQAKRSDHQHRQILGTAWSEALSPAIRPTITTEVRRV